jgi:hypothetical protein
MRFVPPMLLLQKDSLPEGPDWLYEIKLDGYRALAIKSGGRLQLRSRNDNDFTTRYRASSAALAALPAETIVDGGRGTRRRGPSVVQPATELCISWCTARLLRLRRANPRGAFAHWAFALGIPIAHRTDTVASRTRFLAAH